MKKILLFLSLTSFFLFIFCACSRVINDLKTPEVKFDIYKINSYKSNSFYGLIKAQKTSNLAFQAEGRVIYFPYTKGDFVKKGQVLGRLDDILYKIKRQEAIEQLNDYKIKLDRQNKYYKRMDTLYKAGGISDNDWEDAYYSLKTSNQNVAIQNSKIRLINKELSYTTLIAPFDGYVEDTNTQVGEYVSIAQPVLTLIHFTQTQIEVMVDYDIAIDLKPNSTAEIIYDGKIYQGKVKHISKSSLRSGGHVVLIVLDKYYKELFEGLNVEVNFKNNKKLIKIPLKFLQVNNNKTFVFILENGFVKEKNVEIKENDGEYAYISSGLNLGDEIIYSQNSQLKSGMKLK